MQNYINHIALVLDGSSSMGSLVDQVVKVADSQIVHLALRSKELDQETRVSVYVFRDKKIDCLIFDKDVLRLPSLKGLYKASGMTPLIDGTLKAIEDLKTTSQVHGEHAFLIYVLTDGQENSSSHRPNDLSRALATIPDNWTIATFVPNALGVSEAKKFGFQKDNIAIWDVNNVTEVGETIKKTTDNFMVMRSKGVRSTKSLFSLDLTNLNTQAIKKLDTLGPQQFRMIAVDKDSPISEFVEKKTKRAYKLGEAYYQLTKAEKVQPQKTVAIYERGKHTVYTGAGARDLIGLPDNQEVKIEPASHPKYEIFIQSTSVNRKLIKGSNLLLIS